MKMNNKPEIYSSDFLDGFFKEITPKETSKVKKRMSLAAKIDDALRSQGWRKGQLAEALGKSPSEVSKFLSGTHNFTIDTLMDIEDVLNIQLLNIEKEKKEETILVYHAVIGSSETVELHSSYSGGCLISSSHFDVSSATSHIYN
jgi:predicted transcriptional regulator